MRLPVGLKNTDERGIPIGSNFEECHSITGWAARAAIRVAMPMYHTNNLQSRVCARTYPVPRRLIHIGR
jgi:hypothetical protein